VHIDNTASNFLFGPRVSLRYSRIRPYFQVLWRGVYLASSTKVDVLARGPVAADLAARPDGRRHVPHSGPANHGPFAMTAGGGLDIKIDEHLSFRTIGLY